MELRRLVTRVVLEEGGVVSHLEDQTDEIAGTIYFGGIGGVRER